MFAAKSDVRRGPGEWAEGAVGCQPLLRTTAVPQAPAVHAQLIERRDRPCGMIGAPHDRHACDGSTGSINSTEVLVPLKLLMSNRGLQ